MPIPKWVKRGWSFVSAAGTIHWLLSLGLGGLFSGVVGAVLSLGQPWIFMVVGGSFLLVTGGSLAALGKVWPTVPSSSVISRGSNPAKPAADSESENSRSNAAS